MLKKKNSYQFLRIPGIIIITFLNYYKFIKSQYQELQILLGDY